jgi:hypothetical protein
LALYLGAHLSGLVGVSVCLPLCVSYQIRVAAFERCLDFFPYRVLMLLKAMSSVLMRRLFAETVSALAELEADM